uniref:TSC22 domain family member 3 n=1 Tax=Accipiter nisus TaxID=211598 RepID=A0A8B9MPC2_9AVES
MSSSPVEECRSPVGLDCCSCCLDLANRSGLEEGAGGENNNLGSPTVSSFRQLQEQLVRKNLNTDKLSSIMRQDSLEPVVRDPCYLFNQGICNRNIDQTLLSILLLFHRWVSPMDAEGLPVCWVPLEPDPGQQCARELAVWGQDVGPAVPWAARGRGTRMTLGQGDAYDPGAG